MTTLSPNERRTRVLALALLPVGAFLLRTVPAEGLPAWVPFSTSCGAITGLPCIFCGMTRALHFLFQGDFARALYFNWLAFPAVAVFGALILVVLAEVVIEPQPAHPVAAAACDPAFPQRPLGQSVPALGPAGLPGRLPAQTRTAQSRRTALLASRATVGKPRFTAPSA